MHECILITSAGMHRNIRHLCVDLAVAWIQPDIGRSLSRRHIRRLTSIQHCALHRWRGVHGVVCSVGKGRGFFYYVQRLKTPNTERHCLVQSDVDSEGQISCTDTVDVTKDPPTAFYEVLTIISIQPLHI